MNEKNYYIRKVNYYETDMMGFTHHSNYIKYMEEARIKYFNNIGFSYLEMEKQGIISPVRSIECNFKHYTTFEDEIEVFVKIKNSDGITFTMEYIMTNVKTKLIVFVGESVHYFIDKNKKVLRLKNIPEFYSKLLSELEENNN